jgi:hypothetical protein
LAITSGVSASLTDDLPTHAGSSAEVMIWSAAEKPAG